MLLHNIPLHPPPNLAQPCTHVDLYPRSHSGAPASVLVEDFLPNRATPKDHPEKPPRSPLRAQPADVSEAPAREDRDRSHGQADARERALACAARHPGFGAAPVSHPWPCGARRRRSSWAADARCKAARPARFDWAAQGPDAPARPDALRPASRIGDDRGAQRVRSRRPSGWDIPRTCEGVSARTADRRTAGPTKAVYIGKRALTCACV